MGTRLVLGLYNLATALLVAMQKMTMNRYLAQFSVTCFKQLPLKSFTILISDRNDVLCLPWWACNRRVDCNRWTYN